MKPNLVIIALLGLAVTSWDIYAQDNSTATNAASTEPVAAVSTTTTTTTTTTATTNETVSTETVSTNAAAPVETAAMGTNGPAQPGAVIPLIRMNEVNLFDAIENLARQAGLNYMLDPNIQYGQPGPDGKPTAQPSVSIRWENVTAEQALNALLGNYNLQLVEDPKTKISRITAKDPAAPDPLLTHIIQLKYASPSNAVLAVQSTLVDKRSKVVADTRTSQLVIVATERELNAIDEMFQRLDLPTKQVLIEAKLLEVSKSPSSVKGINWTGTLQAQNIAFGNNLQTPPPIDSVNKPLATAWPKLMIDTAKGFNPATAFLDADGVNAVISFLNSDSETKVISTPRAITLDNQTAILSVTRAFPVFSTTAGTQGSPGGSQVNYTNLGTILNVTPHISANNDIQLRVIPEVSSLAGTVTKTVSGVINQADIFDFRRIETQVLIPSGNTLVMGGLISSDLEDGYTKVPGLGDIPVLGYAFRSHSKTQTRKNLLIFITPTVVQDDDFTPAQSDFLKNKTTPDDYNEKVSAWDSGKPYDWSNIGHRHNTTK